MRVFKHSTFLMILSFVLLLAACGNNKEDSSASNPASPVNETRTITHASGDTEITGTPQRVVVLEWTYAEDVLALGVQPVGIADIENMKKYVRIPVEISADAVDIGDRTAPNMELIASLKPDLIIGTQFRNEKEYESLSNIAPTLLFNPYPLEGQGDQYEEMVSTFNTIADVLGKKSEAATVLSNLDAAYEAAKTKVASAGMDKTPIALVMAFSNQNAVTFRISTDNSMAIKILEHIGLTNAHKSDKFEGYGFTTADIEALPALQDANLLHIIQETDNVIDNQLKDNAVWKGLNFVKENRIYALGGDMWPYGGPLSAQIMAEKTADLLTQ